MKQRTRTPKMKQRSIRLVRTPVDGRAGKVVITEDDETTSYLLNRQESEIGGVAWELLKLEVETSEDGSQTSLQIAERYNTLLNGADSSCDCKWGIYGKGKPCRHIAGLLELMTKGKLS